MDSNNAPLENNVVGPTTHNKRKKEPADWSVDTITCEPAFVTCCPSGEVSCDCRTLPYELWEKLILGTEECVPFVPGACMLTSGRLMDEAVVHNLASLKCLPECNKQPTSCSGKTHDGDVGVTASEAGSSPASERVDGQAVTALITSIALLIVAVALLLWLLYKRHHIPRQSASGSIKRAGGYGADADARLTAAAVTQSVTLALATGNGDDRTTNEQLAHAGADRPARITKPNFLRQHWIQVAVPRSSPEIQPYGNEAVYNPSPIRGGRDFPTAATGCITCHSSMESWFTGPGLNSADSCSVPLTAPEADGDSCNMHPISPVMEILSDESVGTELRCGTRDSSEGECVTASSSQLLRLPPSANTGYESAECLSLGEPSSHEQKRPACRVHACWTK